jgi:hypothetical protein
MAGIVADVKNLPDVAVIVIAPVGDLQAEADFAAQIGLDPSQLFPTLMSRLRLRYVPGLVLADPDGRVLFAKEGLLTEDDRVNVVHLATN